jgi:hypothetical protein
VDVDDDKVEIIEPEMKRQKLVKEKLELEEKLYIDDGLKK